MMKSLFLVVWLPINTIHYMWEYIKCTCWHCMCVHAQSCLTLYDPMNGGHRAPLFMEFSRQEYWSRFPFPSPGALPNPGIKPTSLASPALVGGFVFVFFFSTRWATTCWQVDSSDTDLTLKNISINSYHL